MSVIDRRHWLSVEIKLLRTEQKISRRTLSIHSGVSKGAIEYFENGKGDITVSNLERLLKVLGYEIDIHKVSAP